MTEAQIGTQTKDAGNPKRPLEVASCVVANPDHPQYTADKTATKIFPGGKSAMIAVMDGVGSGDEASANASEIVQKNLLLAESPVAAALTLAHARVLLKNAIFQSHLEIKSLQDKLHNTNVDTTVSAGIVCESVDRSTRFLVTVNAGDSRLYRWQPKDGTLTQLTKDHSLVQSKVDAGIITPDQAFSDPQRNLITRSVGDSEHIHAPKDLDTLVFEVNDGDYFLAVSDGVIDNLPPKDLLAAIQNEFSNSFDPKQNKTDLKKFSRGIAQRALNTMKQKTAFPHAKPDDIGITILQA